MFTCERCILHISPSCPFSSFSGRVRDDNFTDRSGGGKCVGAWLSRDRSRLELQARHHGSKKTGKEESLHG